MSDNFQSTKAYKKPAAMKENHVKSILIDGINKRIIPKTKGIKG
jgi:hypothetical protein